MLSKTTTYLIVGLGNPDDKYLRTFHNIGFIGIDEVAKKLGATFSKGECRAITAHIKNGDVKIILAKPITYMNLSGDAVNELVHKYKIERDKFLVIYDDVDLPLGDVRIRARGSAGTHNGMRDIVTKVGTDDFARLRIGIFREHFGDLADYVLSKVTDNEMKDLKPSFERVGNAVEDFTKGVEMDKIMQKYNFSSRKKEQSKKSADEPPTDKLPKE